MGLDYNSLCGILPSESADLLYRVICGREDIYEHLGGDYIGCWVSGVLTIADNLLGGFGVEGYRHEDHSDCDGYEEVLYVNMGDLYDGTVIHYDGEFYATDMGTFREQLEARE